MDSKRGCLQKYCWHAGIEATMSQYDRLTGVKRLRVRGFKAVPFTAILKAVAVNVARAVAAKQARARAQGPYADDRNWSPNCVFRLFKELIGAIYRLIAGRGAVIFTTLENAPASA
ncbi:MAG: hypothetical protein DRH76_11090 [Deltaproteobacteria bacterium]|nr:MAG: hypothetical protein DRH76_11090 [Deltaproteobacteria bacterium]